MKNLLYYQEFIYQNLKKRDEKIREVFIPEKLKEKLLNNNNEDKMEEDGDDNLNKKKTEKDIENENGGSGIYQPDVKKFYGLKNSDWNYDIIPEFYEGKNISDFIDEDILKKI